MQVSIYFGDYIKFGKLAQINGESICLGLQYAITGQTHYNNQIDKNSVTKARGYHCLALTENGYGAAGEGA